VVPETTPAANPCATVPGSVSRYDVTAVGHWMVILVVPVAAVVP
jgi:hypothetical protein